MAEAGRLPGFVADSAEDAHCPRQYQTPNSLKIIRLSFRTTTLRVLSEDSQPTISAVDFHDSILRSSLTIPLDAQRVKRTLLVSDSYDRPIFEFQILPDSRSSVSYGCRPRSY